MAGTSYFNPSGGTSGDSPFYQLRRQINPFTTALAPYGSGSNLQFTRNTLNIWRSGVGNNAWAFDSTVNIALYSTNSFGVESTVASTNLTTVLAGTSTNNLAFYQSSADQCIYVLLRDSGNNFRLCKMSDTTGVVTPIGASFTPATPDNWPLISGAGRNGYLSLDVPTGHLKVTWNGKAHLINKTTGAIVSQDTSVSMGSFTPNGLWYFSNDGTLGIAQATIPTSGGSIGRLLHSTSGYFPPRQNINLGNLGETNVRGFIDSDKLLIGSGYPIVDTSSVSLQVVLRADYDRMLQSIYEYYINE